MELSEDILFTILLNTDVSDYDILLLTSHTVRKYLNMPIFGN